MKDRLSARLLISVLCVMLSADAIMFFFVVLSLIPPGIFAHHEQRTLQQLDKIVSAVSKTRLDAVIVNIPDASDWVSSKKVIEMQKSFRKRCILLMICHEGAVSQFLNSGKNERAAAILSANACSNNVTQQLVQRSSKKNPLFVFDDVNGKELPDLYLPYNSSVYVEKADSKKEMSLIFDTYQFDDASEVRQLLVAELGTSGNFVFSGRSLFQRRWNMEGVNVRCAHFLAKTSGVIREPKDISSYGIDMQVLASLMEALNFTVSFVQPPFPLAIGKKSRNGTWDGLIGLLQRNEADVIISRLIESSERKDVAYFLHSIVLIRFRLFFRRPQFTYSWRAYAEAFSHGVWTFLLSELAILPLLLFLALLVASRASCEEESICNLSWSYLLILGHMCCQGSKVVPSSSGGRILLLTSLLFGYVMYMSYNTVLMTRITARRIHLPFHSLEEILESKTHRIMTYTESSAHRAARHTTSGPLRRLWEKQQEWKEKAFFETLPDGVEEMCTENVVLFIPHVYQGLINCSHIALKYNYFPRHAGYSTRKDFPYGPVISYGVLRMDEAGLLDYVAKKYGKDMETEDDALEVIGMEHLYGAFVLYSICIALSCLVLLAELLYHRLTTSAAAGGTKEPWNGVVLIANSSTCEQS